MKLSTDISAYKYAIGAGGGGSGTGGSGGAGGLVIHVYTTGISNGSVGSGTAGQFAFYNAAGTNLSATSSLFLATSGNIGIGTTSPSDALVIETSVGSGSDWPGQTIWNDQDYISGLQLKRTNSSTIWNILRYGSGGDDRFSIGRNGVADDFNISSSGNVGIGTTSPFRKLSLTDAVSTAQQAIAYDSTRNTDLLTDAAGDFTINPSGDDVFLNADNLWVCTGGSCPSGSPSGTGNLIVETREGIGTTTPDTKLSIETQDSTTNFFRIASTTAQSLFLVNSNGKVGIGTSSPTQQLSISNLLYVGAGGATGLGTATSTFQGDIKIIGKLDVSTIDPPYTIDGVKYATYVPSMTGVKEETTETLQLDTYNSASGKYEAVINFDELEEGSDLWLFYQITSWGEKWKELTVLLTPAFDGQVFYKKDVAGNRLVISGTEEGEVSMRLTAARYDRERWPNLRPDQDGITEGTHVISSKQKGGEMMGASEASAQSAVVATATTAFAYISNFATTTIEFATSTLVRLLSWLR